MFQRLIMAIFRLYINHLVSSYTNTHTHTYIYIYIYGLLMWGGAKVGRRSLICQNDWDVWDAWRVHVVTKLYLSLL